MNRIRNNSFCFCFKEFELFKTSVFDLQLPAKLKADYNNSVNSTQNGSVIERKRGIPKPILYPQRVWEMQEKLTLFHSDVSV